MAPTLGQAAPILELVNGASREQLRAPAPAGVGLHQRAAEAILSFRVGLDGVAGTSDDRRFKLLSELDELPWVGPIAFDRLMEFAERSGLFERSWLPPLDRELTALAECRETGVVFERVGDQCVEVAVDRSVTYELHFEVRETDGGYALEVHDFRRAGRESLLAEHRPLELVDEGTYGASADEAVRIQVAPEGVDVETITDQARGCAPGQVRTSCQAMPLAFCGDGVCTEGESCGSCADDCACAIPVSFR